VLGPKVAAFEDAFARYVGARHCVAVNSGTSALHLALLGADVEYYDELSELLPLTPWNHPNAPGSKVHALNPLQVLYLRHFR